MAKPQEIAELHVDNKIFRDWKTVKVAQRHAQAYHLFEFTATEKTGDKLKWSEQFAPGAKVTAWIAGHLAITGHIVERQVGYDDTNHGVKLIGHTITSDLNKSWVMSPNGNFDKQSWDQIARKVAGEFGVNLKVIGKIDSTPFENVQVNPGELAFAFLERLARSKGIILGSNEKGELVAIGDNSSPIVDRLVEGENILRANASFTDIHLFSTYRADGQRHGNDENRGDDITKQMFELPGAFTRTATILTPMEQPGTNAEVQNRVRFEKLWRDNSTINVMITVQGWLRQNNDLWRVGSVVKVVSPMLPVDEPMSIQSATFTQGSEGTLTELELVKPGLLNAGRTYQNS